MNFADLDFPVGSGSFKTDSVTHILFLFRMLFFNLMIILVGVLVSAQDYEFDEKIPLHKKKADPNMIRATEHQMTIRSSEGDLK